MILKKLKNGRIGSEKIFDSLVILRNYPRLLYATGRPYSKGTETIKPRMTKKILEHKFN